jgi:hypothetical protein
MTDADRDIVLAAILAEQRAIRASIDVLTEALTPSRCRSTADLIEAPKVAMLAAIVSAARARYGDREFSAAELLAATEIDFSISAALSAAGISTAKRIGRALRRIEGYDIGGWRLERLAKGRDGILWRIYATFKVAESRKSRTHPSAGDAHRAIASIEAAMSKDFGR